MLTASPAAACEAFGADVALAAGAILVAAPVFPSNICSSPPSPSVRRFERRGSVWGQTARPTPSLADVRLFGSRIAASGRRVAAGSIWANAPGPGGVPIGNAGAVYVFEPAP